MSHQIVFLHSTNPFPSLFFSKDGMERSSKKFNNYHLDIHNVYIIIH